jgi:hypothetical protein
MKAKIIAKVLARRSAAVNDSATKLARVERGSSKFRLPTNPCERACFIALQKGGSLGKLAIEVSRQFTGNTRTPQWADPVSFQTWAQDYLLDLSSHGLKPAITGKSPQTPPPEANYDPSKLTIEFKEQAPAKWKSGGVTTGTEFFHEANDENFTRLKKGTFRVQVPDDAAGEIIVMIKIYFALKIGSSGISGGNFIEQKQR